MGAGEGWCLVCNSAGSGAGGVLWLLPERGGGGADPCVQLGAVVAVADDECLPCVPARLLLISLRPSPPALPGCMYACMS